MVLSAKHGLIKSTRVIAPYDQKMDEDRGMELSANYAIERAHALVRGLSGWPFKKAFCHGGAHYRMVVKKYESAGVFGGASVSYSHGGMGEQLAQLLRFLEGTG